ncbi:MAG: hypothetical protein AAF468_06345 [Pseudomonadota bacterium]
MNGMDIFLTLVLPLTLTVATFGLPSLHRWLKRLRVQARGRSKSSEEYAKNAMKFLKISDPVKDADLRDLVVFCGYWTADGTKLIRHLLFNSRRVAEQGFDHQDRIATAIGSLTETQRHALLKALASALVHSATQSWLFGRVYASVIKLMISERTNELNEPAQIVKRFQKAKKLYPMGSKIGC